VVEEAEAGGGRREGRGEESGGRTWTARKLENLNSKRSPTLPRSEARCRWSLNIVFPRRRLLPDQQPIRTA
jgi:hypothetical protein